MNLVAGVGDLTNPEDYYAPGDATINATANWGERARPAQVGGSVFVAGGGGAVDVPELVTTITGLTAGEAYDVYGYFYNPSVWDIQFGLSSGVLTAFSVDTDPGVSATTVIPEDNGIAALQASIGAAVADTNGEIQVFIDDIAGGDRSWYSGVGFELVAVPEPSSTVALLAAFGAAFMRRRRN
jgi:hypothetical protein